MKRIIYITATIILLMIVLIGCSKNTENNTKPENEEASVTVTQKVSQATTEAKAKLENSYKILYVGASLKVPNYREIEHGFCRLFIDGNKYISVTNNKYETTASTKEAHEIAFKEMEMSLQNYEGGINSLTISKEETINVNGFEVYSYEGIVNYGTDTKYDAFAKGYSFIVDGVPCEIFASVHGQEQSKAEIDEVSNYLDEMIKTIQTVE